MRAYREWKLSGDTDWLKKIWDKIKLALEFAWKGCGDPPPKDFEWTKEKITMPWDPNKDGVMEGEQHNTYDIEFYGPNTMTGTLYLGALKAAAEMAEALSDTKKAKEYIELFKKGSKRYDKLLWKDDYYIQNMYVLDGLKVPKNLVSPEEECAPGCCDTKGSSADRGHSVNASQKKSKDDTTCVIPKYQYGKGCLSDQLLGQYLAHVVGIGYVLNEDHVKRAVKSIFDYNFKNSMTDFSNVQRVYALNDEAGLLLCSWPHGNRPALPFVYSDEVWTGIEYQVAATLIYNGWTDEGLTIVKAVRDRYDGERRNPWDEEECGHHYARAMASWAVLLALSGFQYDGVVHEMTFAPVVNKNNFNTFWSCGSGWGSFTQKKNDDRADAELQLKYGTLKLTMLSLGDDYKSKGTLSVSLNGKIINASSKVANKKLLVEFAEPIEMNRDDILKIDYK